MINTLSNLEFWCMTNVRAFKKLLKDNNLEHDVIGGDTFTIYEDLTMQQIQELLENEKKKKIKLEAGSFDIKYLTENEQQAAINILEKKQYYYDNYVEDNRLIVESRLTFQETQELLKEINTKLN